MNRWYGFILFFGIVAFPVFGYIDPATGSMLFSLLTGAAVTVFFFLKNAYLKLKYFSPLTIGIKRILRKETSGDKVAGVSGTRPQFVIYSEGKQYWNVFEPILREFDRRGIPCTYYTSGEDDPGLYFPSPSITARYIGRGKRAYRFLNFLEADVCLMTTPGLDVFQLKRSPGVAHYAHILHAVTDATLYRLFGLDYFDTVFLTGPYQEADIRYLEELRNTPRKRLAVVGCTYLDVLSEKVKHLQVERNGKTVLVAPSWGENGILRRFGIRLLRPLAETNYHVIIRPHPQSLVSEREVVERLQQELSSFPHVEWDFDRENLRALAKSDVLISDFSGIIFDFAFLFGGPILYARFEFDFRIYDAGDVPTEPWTFRTLRTIGYALKEKDFERIGEILESIRMDPHRREYIEMAKKEAYDQPGSAAKRVVEELIKIREEVTCGVK